MLNLNNLGALGQALVDLQKNLDEVMKTHEMPKEVKEFVVQTQEDAQANKINFQTLKTKCDELRDKYNRQEGI